MLISVKTLARSVIPKPPSGGALQGFHCAVDSKAQTKSESSSSNLLSFATLFSVVHAERSQEYHSPRQSASC